MALGLSQQEAAQVIGVYGSLLSRWERGRTVPRGKGIQALVHFLGYDPRLPQAA
jgi:transcriptional regulator with XRE-family HTH domain